MKKGSALLLAAALLAALTGCGTNAGEGSASSSGTVEFEVQTWRLACSAQKGTVACQAAEYFADQVSDATNGAVTVEVTAGDKTSDGSDGLLSSLTAGEVDLTVQSSLDYLALDSQFGVLTLPFLFSSAEEAESALEGDGGAALAELLASHGLRAVGFGTNGFRCPTNSVRPITKPQDLQGLRLRVADCDPILRTYRLWGAEAETAAWFGVFTALQTGAFQGQENPLSVADGASIQDVQEYVTDWTGFYDGLFFCMNGKLYDSLSPTVQKVADECGKKAAAYERQLSGRSGQDILAAWSKAGVTVTQLTEEEAGAFRDASAPIRDAAAAALTPALKAAFFPAEKAN
jgi:tripartite ATP-independent transporter DctP family solute receptor